MGIQRGSFENASLGELAKSSNPSYHERNSIASGLAHHAAGIESISRGYGALAGAFGSVSDLMGKFGDIAGKAHKNRGAVLQNVANAESAFREQQSRIKSMIASGQTVDPKEYTALEAAKNNVNEAINVGKRGNDYMMFNFGCKYSTYKGFVEELLRKDPTDENFDHNFKRK